MKIYNRSILPDELVIKNINRIIYFVHDTIQTPGVIIIVTGSRKTTCIRNQTYKSQKGKRKYSTPSDYQTRAIEVDYIAKRYLAPNISSVSPNERVYHPWIKTNRTALFWKIPLGLVYLSTNKDKMRDMCVSVAENAFYDLIKAFYIGGEFQKGIIHHNSTPIVESTGKKVVRKFRLENVRKEDYIFDKLHRWNSQKEYTQAWLTNKLLKNVLKIFTDDLLSFFFPVDIEKEIKEKGVVCSHCSSSLSVYDIRYLEEKPYCEDCYEIIEKSVRLRSKRPSPKR